MNGLTGWRRRGGVEKKRKEGKRKEKFRFGRIARLFSFLNFSRLERS